MTSKILHTFLAFTDSGIHKWVVVVEEEEEEFIVWNVLSKEIGFPDGSSGPLLDHR